MPFFEATNREIRSVEFFELKIVVNRHERVYVAIETKQPEDGAAVPSLVSIEEFGETEMIRAEEDELIERELAEKAEIFIVRELNSRVEEKVEKRKQVNPNNASSLAPKVL